MQSRERVPIPLTWTGEQALDVACFLQEVIDTIWHIHGDSMALVLQARHGPALDADEP